MNTNELAAMPQRLSALLQGLPDPDIDADVQEALDHGLYADLHGDAKATALHFYRIGLLADRLGWEANALANEADGTAAEQRRIEAMNDADRETHYRAVIEEHRARMHRSFEVPA